MYATSIGWECGMRCSRLFSGVVALVLVVVSGVAPVGAVDPAGGGPLIRR